MLFDLKGKRRRTVQVTYVALAFLMAVGLIGAGVGSGVSGGIFDLFGGGGGGSTADKTIEKRIKRAQKALRVNPKDEAAMVSLVRSHYTLASADTNQTTGKFGKDGKKELTKADAAWAHYVDAAKKPDPSLAGLMMIAYSSIGLNDPNKAAGAAEVVASARNDANSWLQLAQFAYAAGQTRKGELAGQKALARAHNKQQRQSVKQQLAQLKKGAAGQAGGATGGAPTSTPTPPGG